MSNIAIASLHKHYTLGLLSGCNSLTDMSEKGYLPYSKQYACKLLAKHPPSPHQVIEKRLSEAPTDAYLAVDFVKVQHFGEGMEGLGRIYDSNSKTIVWGHSFLSSALVRPEHDPYLLGCSPCVDQHMSSFSYPKLTASEAMLTVTGDVSLAGYKIKAVLVDAEFTTRLCLRSLNHLKTPLVGRFKKNSKVLFETDEIKASELAERYPPGQARWYPKLGRYVKRVKVVLKEVGSVDLLIIWKAQGYSWYLTILISTLKGGVQEVMKAWGARWAIEVSHRLRKQSLALGKCQCQSFAAQVRHAQWVIDAFELMCKQRRKQPGLSWKEAQKLAAANLKDALLTGVSRLAA